MAVTAIWAYRGRIRELVDYVRDPEKTEAAPERLAELHAGGTGDGTAHDWKREEKRYVSCLNCAERYAAEQIAETQRLWSVITGRDKAEGRTCFHGYQSFREGEVTAETAHEIGVKLAERMWGRARETVVATHCNTDHFHNHFVLNAVSFSDGRKERYLIAQYRRMRSESDRLCREYGISVEEEPAARSPKYGERLAERSGKPTLRSLIRDDIDRTAAASVTPGEFFRSLEEMGYELSLRDEDGRLLRYPALKPPGAKGFFGFHRLGGKEYGLEEILDRVADNYRRRVPFPEEERRIVRAYREKILPLLKPTGLYALYLRYCFELHILEKHPASVKRLPFSVREDLIRLDKLDAQARFLGEYGIGTAGELDAFRESREEEYGKVRTAWMGLRRELARAVRSGEEDRAAEIRAEKAETAREMTKIRREIKLCGEIGERSSTMEDKLRILSTEQILDDERKEEKDEHVFERGGGTGRPHDAGRG